MPLIEHRSATNDTIAGAGNSAAAAPEKARRLVGENAVLIGSLGIAIGAIIAATLRGKIWKQCGKFPCVTSASKSMRRSNVTEGLSRR